MGARAIYPLFGWEKPDFDQLGKNFLKIFFHQKLYLTKVYLKVALGAAQSVSSGAQRRKGGYFGKIFPFGGISGPCRLGGIRPSDAE